MWYDFKEWLSYQSIRNPHLLLGFMWAVIAMIVIGIWLPVLT